jgi:membrane protein
VSEQTSADPAGKRDPAQAAASSAADPLDLDAPQTARGRLDALGHRFEEPIGRVTTLTNKTLALFPVRVWRHFLSRNGFILSAGMSYQALFAIFAGVYVVFAVAGIWLTSNQATLDALAALLNTYAPGLIGEEGIISMDELVEIASSSTSLFGWTGAVALAGLIWTAISWVTYARIAVRSIFGLPKDTRAYALLKARDFLAGFAFGAILLVAAALSVATSSFLGRLAALFGLPAGGGWSDFLVQGGAILVVFIIDTLALAVMFRFLSGAAMPWRRMWVGSLLGAAAISALQLLSGLLFASAAANALLATFAVFIGLLLWFRLTGIVILVAAAWVAVEASDAHETLRKVTPEALAAEEREREQLALVTAARVRVREARNDVAAAGWIARIPARRRLARAEDELVRAEASVGAAGARTDVGGLP